MTKKEITQLSYQIIGYAIKIHKKLEPGLLEKIYEECLKYELEQNGYNVKQQVTIEVDYYNLKLENPLRLDLLVNDCIIIELKTVEKFHPIDEAKLMTYMKLLSKPQGLLINFNTTNITKSTKPLVNEYFFRLADD
jgi:GxxExxY protein